MEQDIYVGTKKVKSNETLDKKLSTDEDLFKVDYEDGTSEVLTRKMFEGSISNEPVDDDDLLNSQFIAITTEILPILLNWGLKLNLIDTVLDRVGYSVKMNTREVTDAVRDEVFDRVFGKKFEDVNLSDLDSVLRSGSYKTITKETTPTEPKVTVDEVISSDSEPKSDEPPVA